MTRYHRDLARLRDGRYYSKKAEKPVVLKTESGVTLEIPGPRILAEVFTLPWLLSRVEAYRSGSALLTRRSGSDEEPKAIHQGELATELLEALKNLPELSRAEAGRPYRDLRLYVSEASPATRSAYLADVVAHTRRLLPEWRPPAPQVVRGPAKTAAERKAVSRERIRREQELSAREWLQGFSTGWDGDAEPPSPGSRWIASELYQAAREAIEEYIDLEEERLDGGTFVLPGKRVFYAVADELLGPRRRGAKGRTHVYVIRSSRYLRPRPELEPGEVQLPSR